MERQKDKVIKILGIIVFVGLIVVIGWFLFYNTYNTNENAGMETAKEASGTAKTNLSKDYT